MKTLVNDLKTKISTIIQGEYFYTVNCQDVLLYITVSLVLSQVYHQSSHSTLVAIY